MRVYSSDKLAEIICGLALANTDTGFRRLAFLRALAAVGMAVGAWGLLPEVIQQAWRSDGEGQP